MWRSAVFSGYGATVWSWQWQLSRNEMKRIREETGMGTGSICTPALCYCYLEQPSRSSSMLGVRSGLLGTGDKRCRVSLRSAGVCDAGLSGDEYVITAAAIRHGVRAGRPPALHPQAKRWRTGRTCEKNALAHYRTGRPRLPRPEKNRKILKKSVDKSGLPYYTEQVDSDEPKSLERIWA